MNLVRYSVKTTLHKLRYYLLWLRKYQSKLSAIQLTDARLRIKALWSSISMSIGSKQLRSCLGASLVASLMASSQVQAQSFADPVAKHQVEFKGIMVPELGDVDQDGDLDIIGVGIDYDTTSFGILMGFQENIGTPQTAEFTIPSFGVFGLGYPEIDDSILLDWEVADLDNDGDSDLLGFGLIYNDIGYSGATVYYENIGSATEPLFDDFVISDLNIQNHLGLDLTLVDFDSDGDLDVLFLGGQYEYNSNEDTYFFNVLYFENVGDASSFELTEGIINPGFNRFDPPEGFEESVYYFSSLDMADFDLDGDLDAIVLINSYDSDYGSKFFYAENVDNEFGEWKEVENLAFLPETTDNDQFLFSTVGDLDGDGDVDLFYSLAGETVDEDDMTNTYFVENLAIVSSTEEELQVLPISIYPSVTSQSINVVFEEENRLPISLLSSNGSLVKQFKSDRWVGQQTFDVAGLPSGQYYVRVINDEKTYTMPFVKQ